MGQHSLLTHILPSSSPPMCQLPVVPTVQVRVGHSLGHHESRIRSSETPRHCPHPGASSSVALYTIVSSIVSSQVFSNFGIDVRSIWRSQLLVTFPCRKCLLPEIGMLIDWTVVNKHLYLSMKNFAVKCPMIVTL